LDLSLVRPNSNIGFLFRFASKSLSWILFWFNQNQISVIYFGLPVRAPLGSNFGSTKTNYRLFILLWKENPLLDIILVRPKPNIGYLFWFASKSLSWILFWLDQNRISVIYFGLPVRASLGSYFGSTETKYRFLNLKSQEEPFLSKLETTNNKYRLSILDKQEEHKQLQFDSSTAAVNLLERNVY